MAPCVGRSQPRGLYPSVDLGRGDRGVAEQLLDRAQVRAAVQQVRRERVAQRVRRDAPAAPAAWRAHTRRRRRTSEVESRRPDFDRNSARVASARRRAPAGRASGSARARAAPARRSARSASCRPCPRRARARRRSRSRRGRGSRAPRRAGRRRRRARTARGRAARARVSAGMRSSSAATSRGLQHARQALLAARRGQQVGRVLLEHAVLDERAEQRAQRGELARDRARRLAGLGQARGVAAQQRAA